jgi:hypothetical protein
MDARRGEIPHWPQPSSGIGSKEGRRPSLPVLAPVPDPDGRPPTKARRVWVAPTGRDGGTTAWASSSSSSAGSTPPPQRGSPAASTMGHGALHPRCERVAWVAAWPLSCGAASATPASGHRSSRQRPFGLCCGAVVAMPCAAREGGGRDNRHVGPT